MQQWLKLITERVRRLLTQPVAELSLFQRSLRSMIVFAEYCALEMRRDRAGTMAAALTYHTLFSLLPTLVLMLVVSSVFVSEADRARFKEQTVNWALEWIELPENQVIITTEPKTPQQQIEDELTRQQEFEQARAALNENLESLLHQLEAVNLSGIGVIGLLVFIYGATGLLATIESSFNLVYKAQSDRPWYLRMVYYYFVISLAPLIILAGQVMQSWFIGLIDAGSWTNWLARPMVVLSPLLTTWGVMSFTFLLLPNTRVRVRYAVVGGFITALGWVAAGELYGLYVSQAGGSSLYGALALLPLSLMYLWILWLIVLFGLEVAYTLQTMPSEGLPKTFTLEEDDGPVLLTGAALVAVAAVVGRAFAQGGVVTTGTVSQELGINMATADGLLARLENWNLIRYVEGKRWETGGWALTRPPTAIPLSTMIERAHKDSPLKVELPEMEKLMRGQLDALGDRTLANLVEGDSA
ncbi:YhjD/YihY/BrkB family envelope integrity protein [Mucisphaera calidilacus]|uniref:YihY family inner membrane protein n=1 Tax=Mucisphaera calidilacus TaxID=2527982 RepID=A0A518BZT0_9BACT|nr:YhjD/YihY/BrkB family envelope integrity protein [Mucisphaera calidilacus]QDU72459.1 ribonuclease BN/unknown domain fusion protein [Mucisphaera calidilacus]